MNFITPQNREQITFGSLEDKITTDNPVRFVDGFVEQLELEKVNFFVAQLDQNRLLSLNNPSANVAENCGKQ